MHPIIISLLTTLCLLPLVIIAPFISGILKMRQIRRASPANRHIPITSPYPTHPAGDLMKCTADDNRAVEYAHDCRKRLGPIYVQWIGPEPWVMCQDLTLRKKILFESDPMEHRITTPLDGVLVKLTPTHMEMYGEKWLRIVKPMRAASLPKVLSRLVQIFNKGAKEELVTALEACVRSGEDIDVSLPLRSMAMKVGVKGILGSQEDVSVVAEALERFVTHTRHPVHQIPILRDLPFIPAVRAVNESSAVVRKFTYTVCKAALAARKAGVKDPEKTNPFLDIVCERFEAGELSMDEMRDLAVAVVMGAYDTTAATLSWAYYALAKHPECQEKVREEINTKLPGLRDPTYEDLGQLPYTEAFIKESQRRYSVIVVGVPRTFFHPIELNGFTIPANTKIGHNLFDFYFNPEYFANPFEFNPENFFPEAEAKRDATIWSPFGQGLRMCSGRRFAQMEIKVAIAMTMQRFRLTLSKNHREGAQLNLARAPKYGVLVHAEAL